MKKLVSLALVAVLLCGAVAFADPSDIKIMNYSQGDLGGVYSDQIDKAIGSGGQLTGEPLPKLPWQNAAQYGTFVTWLDRFLLDDPSAVTTVIVAVDPTGLIPTDAIPGGATLDELKAYVKALIAYATAEGEDFVGGFYSVGKNLYFVNPDGTPWEVKKDVNGNYIYVDKTTSNTPVSYAWIPGTGENDPGKMVKVVVGGDTPAGASPDWTPDPTTTTAPAYVAAGFYSGTGGVYQVSSSGVVTGPYLSVSGIATYASADGTKVWDVATNKWDTRTGASASTPLAKEPKVAADKAGYYLWSTADGVQYWAAANSAGTMKYAKPYANNTAAAGAITVTGAAPIISGTSIADTGVYWNENTKRFEALSNEAGYPGYPVIWNGAGWEFK